MNILLNYLQLFTNYLQRGSRLKIQIYISTEHF